MKFTIANNYFSFTSSIKKLSLWLHIITRMKKLYIVRHAKSSWEVGQDDFDRSLKKKGKLNAPFMAGKLLSRGVNVEQIISSSAKRTTKTTGLINQVLGIPESMVSFNKELYLPSQKDIIKQIQ